MPLRPTLITWPRLADCFARPVSCRTRPARRGRFLSPFATSGQARLRRACCGLRGGFLRRHHKVGCRRALPWCASAIWRLAAVQRPCTISFVVSANAFRACRSWSAYGRPRILCSKTIGFARSSGADYFTTSLREALEILRRSRPPEGRRGRRLSGDCIGRPTMRGPADAIGRRSVFRIWSELFERVSEERIIWGSWSGMRAEIGLAMIGRSNINRMLTLRAAR